METKKEERQSKVKQTSLLWVWVIASVIFRLLLIYFPKSLNLSSRPEVATPLTSIRHLAEGSMYHGSPLLLSLIGPLTVKRIEGQPNHLLCSLLFVLANVVIALLICATGQTLQMSYSQSLKSLDLVQLSKNSEILSSGDITALVYLWNPFTSPFENLVFIISLYGACTRLPTLVAFGWVMATHLSLYPVVLIIPMLLLGNCFYK